MPEMDNQDPNSSRFFPAEAKPAQRFRGRGRAPVDDSSKGSKDTDFLNSIFGWDLAEADEQRSGYDLNTATPKTRCLKAISPAVPQHNGSHQPVRCCHRHLWLRRTGCCRVNRLCKGQVIYLGEDFWERRSQRLGLNPPRGARPMPGPPRCCLEHWSSDRTSTLLEDGEKISATALGF